MRRSSSNEQPLRYTEDEHEILLRILSLLHSKLLLYSKHKLYVPSSRTFPSRTAHDHSIELFAELYIYFEDCHDYYSASLVLHYSEILGLRYNVWRFVSTGISPSEEFIETWAFVDSDNLDAF